MLPVGQASAGSILLDVFTRSAAKLLLHVLDVLYVLCQVGVEAHPGVLPGQLGSSLHEVLGDVERGAGG